MIGLEPITCWLQISCSANWATSACCNRIKPQKSHFHYLNDSKGIWTPVTAVKGRCLNHLTKEPDSPSRTWTYDSAVNSRVLYRLSYRGIFPLFLSCSLRTVLLYNMISHLSTHFFIFFEKFLHFLFAAFQPRIISSLLLSCLEFTLNTHEIRCVISIGISSPILLRITVLCFGREPIPLKYMISCCTFFGYTDIIKGTYR